MSTGSHHFELAEEYLQSAKETQNEEGADFCLAVADVHATLALVAATLESKTAQFYRIDTPPAS